MKENTMLINEFRSASMQAEVSKTKILKMSAELFQEIVNLARTSRQIDSFRSQLKNTPLNEEDEEKYLEVLDQYNSQVDIFPLPLFTKIDAAMSEIMNKNKPDTTNQLSNLPQIYLDRDRMSIYTGTKEGSK